MDPDPGVTALAAALAQRYRTQAVSLPSDGAALDRWLRADLDRSAPLLGSCRSDVLRLATAELVGLGPLDGLLGDPRVTEIMVNGPGAVLVERDATISPSGLDLDAVGLDRLVERLLAPSGRRVDRLHPIADARLRDGSRAHVVVPPVAVDGPYVTIRRFTDAALRIEDFTDADTAASLRSAVRARTSIVVSGATGSGKTTLLGALAAAIDGSERIVTIEDTAELRLQHPHVVRLEAQAATAEGLGAVSARDLVRASLRMRPSRILVGEVRGGEAFDMLAAMSTGHPGSMSTVHADAALDARRRLELMVLLAGVALPFEAVRQLVATTVGLVVHVRRGSDGRRSIVEIDGTL